MYRVSPKKWKMVIFGHWVEIGLKERVLNFQEISNQLSTKTSQASQELQEGSKRASREFQESFTRASI